MSPKSFSNSKLRGYEQGDIGMRNWYRELLGIRKKMRACGLVDQSNLSIESQPEDGLFILHYTAEKTGKLTVASRLVTPKLADSESPIEVVLSGDLLLDSHGEKHMPQTPGPMLARKLYPNQSIILHDPR